jgi:transposase
MADIIRDSLTLSLDLMFENREDAIIVQDNDPKHKSKIVKLAIEEEKLNFIEDYPANSPDLNPIENLWTIWKKEVHKHHPKTLEELDLWA